ncbi:hypothetical protein WA026_020412 [Henosepilachna vigintioctopunctata]|uniref:Uncharacterized protein n=1 Tax=Henosepilachna vigintioctopunctata TaxID=420089 RepID=A0AAW1UQP3_9CUCU
MFQSTVASGPSQSSSPQASMAVTSSAPASGTPPTSAQRCCDTGRPLFTDPISGQSVCSCQYELLGYQRLASAGVPGLPALSMYSAPYPEGMAAYFPALGADQAPFYSTPVRTFRYSYLPRQLIVSYITFLVGIF